ncbi:MAG: PDZ domain-containing protein [Acidobacteriota bacterium]
MAKVKLMLILFLLLLFIVFPFSIFSSSPEQISEWEKDVQRIMKKVSPSVVKLYTEYSKERGIRTVCSGFVIDEGYILTNALIARGDGRIIIQDYRGEKIEGELINTDWENSLALIKYENKNLKKPGFGKLTDLSVGSWVAFIGTSYDSFPSISQGIVNSIKDDVIRLNLTVPPGGSGGAVVNSKGEIVGILRGVYSRDFYVFSRGREKVAESFYRGSMGTGITMAISIKKAQKIYRDLKEKKGKENAWLGVSIGDEDDKVKVYEVEEDSPADKGGIEEGDFILSVDGEKIGNSDDLAKEIRSRKPGDTIKVEIEREGKIVKKEVTLGRARYRYFPYRYRYRFPERFEFMFGPKVYLGVRVKDIEESDKKRLGLANNDGALIIEVFEDSNAERMGLKKDDVIIKIDDEEIKNSDDVIELIREKEPGDEIRLEVIRDKKQIKFSGKLSERKYLKWDWNWEDFRRHLEDVRRVTEESLKKALENLKKKEIIISIKKDRKVIEI